MMCGAPLQQAQHGLGAEGGGERRQVVEQDRTAERGGRVQAERLDVLLRVAEEQRRRQEHRSCTRVERGTPEGHHVGRRRGADADEQRAIADPCGGPLDQVEALVARRMWIFGGGATEADAVDAGCEQQVEHAIEGGDSRRRRTRCAA